MKINNMPEYAYQYGYIVANRVDGELWFYGAYSDYYQAFQIAEML